MRPCKEQHMDSHIQALELCPVFLKDLSQIQETQVPVRL